MTTENSTSIKVNDSDYEDLCTILCEKDSNNGSKKTTKTTRKRKKVVRDRAYFAAAARKSRKRKKDLAMLQAQNEVLQQEVERLTRLRINLEETLQYMLSPQVHWEQDQLALANENTMFTRQFNCHPQLRKSSTILCKPEFDQLCEGEDILTHLIQQEEIHFRDQGLEPGR